MNVRTRVSPRHKMNKHVTEWRRTEVCCSGSQSRLSPDIAGTNTRGNDGVRDIQRVRDPPHGEIKGINIPSVGRGLLVFNPCCRISVNFQN